MIKKSFSHFKDSFAGVVDDILVQCVKISREPLMDGVMYIRDTNRMCKWLSLGFSSSLRFSEYIHVYC